MTLTFDAILEIDGQEIEAEIDVDVTVREYREQYEHFGNRGSEPRTEIEYEVSDWRLQDEAFLGVSEAVEEWVDSHQEEIAAKAWDNL